MVYNEKCVLLCCIILLGIKRTRSNDCLRVLLDAEFSRKCSTYPAGLEKPCKVELDADLVYLRSKKMYTSFDLLKGKVCAVKDGAGEAECISCTLKKKSPSVDISFTMDNKGKAFADGVLLSDNAPWDHVVTRQILHRTAVVAFEVENSGSGNPVGPRAWLSFGLRTDTMSGWKCSLSYEEGWNQPGFNDDHWQRQIDVQHAGGAPIGHGAITIGCGSDGAGPFYFRRTLYDFH